MRCFGFWESRPLSPWSGFALVLAKNAMKASTRASSVTSIVSTGPPSLPESSTPWGGLPSPRSRMEFAAAMRAAGGAFLSRTMEELESLSLRGWRPRQGFQTAPQVRKHLARHSRAYAAGINEFAIVSVVAQQKCAEIGPRSFRVRPTDDDEFLPVEAFGLAP
jgi:hypothetical protein